MFNPALLLQGSWTEIVPAVVTAMIGCYALAGSVAGYLRARNTLWESALLLIAAALLIAPVLKASAVGAVLLGAIWAWQTKKTKSASNGCLVGRAGS
ncbi:hypothetical protein D3C85_1625860 [compost metagenome]